MSSGPQRPMRSIFDHKHDQTPARDIDTEDEYQRAVDLVIELDQVSVSMLQRRFRLGYAAAARMVDRMEREGIVGPFQGGRPREVYGR